MNDQTIFKNPKKLSLGCSQAIFNSKGENSTQTKQTNSANLRIFQWLSMSYVLHTSNSVVCSCWIHDHKVESIHYL